MCLKWKKINKTHGTSQGIINAGPASLIHCLRVTFLRTDSITRKVIFSLVTVAATYLLHSQDTQTPSYIVTIVAVQGSTVTVIFKLLFPCAQFILLVLNYPDGSRVHNTTKH